MAQRKKTSKPLKKLNKRHLAFVNYYCTHPECSAFEAYKATYRCSDKTAYANGPVLLKKTEIAALISKKQQKSERLIEVTIEKIQQELAHIAFARQDQFCKIGEDGSLALIPFEDMPEGSSAAIAGIEETRRIMTTGKGKGEEIIVENKLKFKRWDKVKALELLGRQKRLQMFSDKQEIDLKIKGVKLVID